MWANFARDVLGARKRYHNIVGAPFRLGAYVEVVGPLDEVGEDGFEKCGISVGDIGWVEFYEYDCGCGQRWPEWPMIGVLLTTGVRYEFWREELKRIPRPDRRLP